MVEIIPSTAPRLCLLNERSLDDRAALGLAVDAQPERGARSVLAPRFQFDGVGERRVDDHAMAVPPLELSRPGVDDLAISVLVEWRGSAFDAGHHHDVLGRGVAAEHSEGRTATTFEILDSPGESPEEGDDTVERLDRIGKQKHDFENLLAQCAFSPY